MFNVWLIWNSEKKGPWVTEHNFKGPLGEEWAEKGGFKSLTYRSFEYGTTSWV